MIKYSIFLKKNLFFTFFMFCQIIYVLHMLKITLFWAILLAKNKSSQEAKSFIPHWAPLHSVEPWHAAPNAIK